MKTYNCIYAFVALVIVGCSKSDEGGEGNNQQISVDADYVTLLTNGNILTAQLLNANAEVITLNPAENSFVESEVPQLSATDGTTFFQYHRTGDCNANVTKHDFAKDETEQIVLFDDLSDCSLTANTIAFSDSSLFIGYELETDSKTFEYMLRVIDLNSSEFSFIDVPLSKKPVNLALANNRLFILTLDTEISQENFLTVMDLDSNELIAEMKLGLRARRIFRDTATNIIISYDELHSTLNSETLSIIFTNYTEGTEPKFTANRTDNFDLEGRLYYPAPSGTLSTYPEIPAVYDFSQNLTTLYVFENFLTEAKRNFEFEIETATAINYDEENNLILIGYKKIDKQEGGLLRIKPAPEPEFIDNIDLAGVPYEIIIN